MHVIPSKYIDGSNTKYYHSESEDLPSRNLSVWLENCHLQALGLPYFIRKKHRGFVPGGLILGVKKLFQNQAIAVLMKIRFAFTGF